MNKIKALYDVVKTMKNKETFNGTLMVQVHKDEAQLFSLRNEFEKSLLTGQTKAKINSELDYEGNTVKHESNTEFTRLRSGECRHHEFIRHLHPGHANGCRGLKGQLSRLAFALSILTALQTKELDGKTSVISLNATDLPEDTKALLREKINHAGACHGHHRHAFLKEFGEAADIDFVVELSINKNCEVEKIVATLVGTQKDEKNVAHDLTARAELSFVW
ncbi:MAG: hypothetical protein P4N59_04575 [Negativicutes bacterium]|nr:hypothetical protein [Negativicutes bacterium]